MRVAAVFWACTGCALACAPASDLDVHARGGGAAVSSEEAPAAGAPGVAASPALEPAGASAPASTLASTPASGGEASSAEGLAPPPLDPGSSAAADAGVPPVESGGGPADASPPSEPPPPPPIDDAPPVLEDAPPLPDDLIDAPVAGEIVFSGEAEWEVDGVFEPTFEIHTPTASYWVVKPLGTIVSIEDGEPDAAQWVAFSSGFRPLRGVPSFPTPPATRVTTVRDDDSQTPTHLRLTAVSDDGLWHWVWDFYVTHVTLTVNRAPLPFGFAYQGVPGGSLGPEDRLVSNAAVSQGARSSFNGDLEGPVEWAYLADTALGRSIFALQHQDDALPERYVVRDNDTSLFSFGNGQLAALPQRFSLGLIPSVAHAELSERVEFIARSIR